MGITCGQIWREASDYIENGVSSKLRKEINLHLVYCRRCAAILNGVGNIVTVAADKRIYPLPHGFEARMRARLRTEL